MLYDGFYARLERARWDMEEDVPWADLDPSRIGPQQRTFVKANALIEWTSSDATEAFLRDFSFDPDFTSFISVWFYEEMKHFLVLKRYAQMLGETISPQECAALRVPVGAANPFNILTVHFIGEFRLASWYYSLAKVFQEPVLQRIYQLIAADEVRHGVCYVRYLRKFLAASPRELTTVLKTSLFMLRRSVHPTVLTGTVGKLEGAEKVYRYLDEILDAREKAKAERRVFAYLSDMCGRPIRDLHDVLGQLKTVRAAFRPA